MTHGSKVSPVPGDRITELSLVSFCFTNVFLIHYRQHAFFLLVVYLFVCFKPRDRQWASRKISLKSEFIFQLGDTRTTARTYGAFVQVGKWCPAWVEGNIYSRLMQPQALVWGFTSGLWAWGQPVQSSVEALGETDNTQHEQMEYMAVEQWYRTRGDQCMCAGWSFLNAVVMGGKR